MLVKIVNLSDNRFKNCQYSNFSNEQVYFGIRGGKKPNRLIQGATDALTSEAEHDSRMSQALQKALDEEEAAEKAGKVSSEPEVDLAADLGIEGH